MAGPAPVSAKTPLRRGVRVSTTGSDQTVYSGKARLLMLVSEATSTGTIAIKDGSTTLLTLAIGGLVLGTAMPFHGLQFDTSIILNISAGAAVLAVYEPVDYE